LAARLGRVRRSEAHRDRRTAGALGLQPGHDCAGLPADPVGVGPALGIAQLGVDRGRVDPCV